MFWRLFLSYLLLVVAAVAFVGAVMHLRAEAVFWELFHEVAVAVGVVILGSACAAGLLASRLSQPLVELNEGARRLADGDLTHRIEVGGHHEVATLAGTINDMSGRLSTMLRLLEHDREQLRAILSGMVEGVVAIDDRRRVLFANDRAGKLLGFVPDQAVKQTICDAIPEQPFRDIVETGLAAAEPHRAELDWKGPPVRNLAIYISRFPGHGMPGAVIVVHDTTELRQVEKLRQDFVANVSHELKTPLAVIKSSVETLVDGAAEDPESREMFLTQITRESERLEELIQDLLSLARIESGNLGLEPMALPLGQAITDCVERHQGRAETKTLTMVEKPPSDVRGEIFAWADPDALRQVMDNLVDNAIKYTPNGGRITVRWTQSVDTVSFEVEDTGVGIPPEDLQRVFERFYRADKARSRTIGGTGLGLAIVKHLVQAMKGQVRASSTVGKGTTFRVTLPRAAD